MREPCLEWALEFGQEAGVWGATTEEERRSLKRRRAARRAARGTG
ncbi:WhiB family transcriptional regulator [Streptomyces sp. NPDC059979]